MSGSFYDVFTASLGCAYLAFVSGNVVSGPACPPATLFTGLEFCRPAPSAARWSRATVSMSRKSSQVSMK